MEIRKRGLTTVATLIQFLLLFDQNALVIINDGEPEDGVRIEEDRDGMEVTIR
jgi:hypothetical protein